ncbi:single-stranded-DNA-specific exonuclease RecJ [Paracrocinitomix mangrovi]|uniref:single-stranded-DNA-specific exonuclease RecJ n=1 Tax=Paracrocinitomix mangrovi TaxID=2862509 RepID=UPI001C8D9F0C|nr:single-stranded-DNA-specific exonuclease RecJ [Paracrocinitomix mangrovi]UKN00955.1 single-stranded-DNA-specific exonuclease RecJ [Paracrocinitomix mangrovi]
MNKRWVFKAAPERESVAKLIEEVGVSRPLAVIMAQRGIQNFDEAKAFFRPEISDLHDPFLMEGMEAAVNRIEQAIAANENILIYGDYDVDGTSSVALVYSYLTRTYEQVGYYIPDRYAEGYGVSEQGIEFASDNSFSLIIALDCGTKAVDLIAKAKEEGIDFIVCDHHTPGRELPDAILLNPKQEACNYPYKELCGCGIGFKLVQGIQQSRGEDFDEIYDLLDLVMVAIGADIVPITGENRILAYYGLHVLNNNPRIGFKQLLMLANKTGELSVTDVVFTIAPRINAAGRIDSGNKAVELLLADTVDEVEEISLLINQHNEVRKGLDKDITNQALEMIANDPALLNAKSTVVFNEGWHKGVVGIVASRLTENYYRPTIVLTESNGMAVGSARSVKGFNVYDAIDECSDLLEQFGGHFYAAGLTLPLENIEAFRNKFESVVSNYITKKQLTPEIEIDCEIDFRDIFLEQRGGIPRFYRVMKQLAPFGPGNMRPVFVTRNVKDAGGSRVLKDEHLKLSLKQDEYSDITVNAIAFGMAEWYNALQYGAIDIVYTIEENNWNGNVSLQLVIKDIKESKPPL